MIHFALEKYLSAPDLSSPSDIVPFRKPIKFGKYTLENRNDARRALQGRVGDRIYAGRQLQPSGQEAITIRTISGQPDVHLKGDHRTSDIVEIQVFAKGNNANIRANVTNELVRIAISHYVGNWGTDDPVYVAACFVVRNTMEFNAPRDGSHYWTHRNSTDYQINYAFNIVEV